MGILNKENIHSQKVSSAREEVKKMIEQSPTRQEVDDKLTIANLEESLNESKRKLNRRTFVAGATGIAAGAITSIFVKKSFEDNSVDQRSQDSINSETSPFENTLNPDSQLGDSI